MKKYYIYILTNFNKTVLYAGVTNNVRRRVCEHKQGIGSKFTKRYKVNRLMYYEEFDFIVEAISREKQLKAGSRAAKTRLTDLHNPSWIELDLSG